MKRLDYKWLINALLLQSLTMIQLHDSDRINQVKRKIASSGVELYSSNHRGPKLVDQICKDAANPKNQRTFSS